MADTGGAALIVSTERLGWPPARRGWRRWIPWETQSQLIYADHPDEPSATCRLQRHERAVALCGYPWELLAPVPASPAWGDLHPEMRCDACSGVAGITTEDPAGRQYGYRWSRT